MNTELKVVKAYKLSNGDLVICKDTALLDVENCKLKSRLIKFLSDSKLDLPSSTQDKYLKFLMANKKTLSNIFK